MDLLVMTKLSVVFDIFTSEDDAVNSFFPNRSLRYPRAMRQEEGNSPVSKADGSPLTVFYVIPPPIRLPCVIFISAY
jgi:hypothetical protein